MTPAPDQTTPHTPAVEPAPSRRDSRATLDPTRQPRPHKINITDQDHRNGLLADSGLRKWGGVSRVTSGI